MSQPQTWHLGTRHLGRTVQVYDEIDSTNSRAAELASDPANDGLVVLARRQTAGRGQYGRQWECPPDRGVLLSVLLFPPPTLRRPVLLTALAAVAVAETIRQVANVQARIKWPNDLLLAGRKTCGILIEQGIATVIGIGLNVRQTASELEAAGLPDATSLHLACGRMLDPQMVARSLIHQLDQEYAQLVDGDLATLEARWKWRTGLLGKPVRIERLDGSLESGTLRDMTFDAISWQRGDDREQLAPEWIRHLLPL